MAEDGEGFSGRTRSVNEIADTWRSVVSRDLWSSVIPFWLRHSLDHENGGYWNCLDDDGARFDDLKHVWLQGRQVWMLSKLFGESREERYLRAASLGASFLAEHAVGADGRAFFALRGSGEPVALQRKIFSECFLVMAFAEYARASGERAYRERAMTLFDSVLSLVADPTPLGRPSLIGQTPSVDLAVPMILLNLVGELRGEPGSETFHERADFDAIEQDCVTRVLRHWHPERHLTFETVAPDGALLLEGAAGRLLNPGHVIETAWFLIQYAQRAGDDALIGTALAMLESALDLGWDDVHGGLYYFLDSEGFSPTQLEWSMKLWWPHCEAMVGTLVAWRATGDDRWLMKFERVAEWTYAHFPDPEHGEWFGYLDREGRVSQRFKGGPYKGCFHVPRALWMCEKLLDPGNERSGPVSGDR
ncbi:MAG: AGE family epimerase/isomerase [Planctomycetota bacterium]